LRARLSRLVAVFLAVVCSSVVTARADVFATLGIHAQALGAEQLPYEHYRPLPLAGDGLMDIHGVRMFSLNGYIYNHPAAQAQYALRNLEAYRVTGTYRYLARARSNALRLVTNRVVSSEGAAWFFPYPFNFACCQGDLTMPMKAPWYSALAQGQALSVFVRLYRITGRPEWRAAADAAFSSLLIPSSEDEPWVSRVDADGHLWLEEYPRWPEEASERVLNGHVFALFGVYDFLRLLDTPQARELFLQGRPAQARLLFDGAVTTAEQTLPKFRQPGGPALYSLEHGIAAPSYQAILVAEYRCLKNLTGRSVDGADADLLYSDYPRSPFTAGFQPCWPPA
jgi:hypothetical protein